MAKRCDVAPPTSSFATPYFRRIARWQSQRTPARGAEALHLYPFGGLRACLAKVGGRQSPHISMNHLLSLADPLTACISSPLASSPLTAALPNCLSPHKCMLADACLHKRRLSALCWRRAGRRAAARADRVPKLPAEAAGARRLRLRRPPAAEVETSGGLESIQA